MDAVKVKEVLVKYRELLSQTCASFGKQPKAQLSEHYYERNFDDIPVPDIYQHLVWMCDKACELIDDGQIDKSMRWLGFIQGCLWFDGAYSINEMRDDNR